MTSERNCLTCNKEFVCIPSSEKRCCSRSCAVQYRAKDNRLNVSCVFCNKEINCVKSRIRRFCSKKCSESSRFIQRTNCGTCNKAIVIYGKSKANGQGKYCSRACNRTYKLNYRYFKKIDNATKAYWLGFIYADGCLHRKGAMCITLNSQDINHLEKLKISLSYEGPVKINNQGYATVLVTSKIFGQDLFNQGVIPAKSLTAKFPSQLPLKNIRHFIRGVFDGDGCLYCTNRKRKKSSLREWRASIFSGSKDFADSLVSELKSAGLEPCYKPQANGYLIYFSKRSQLLLLYNYLYKGNKMCLDRKFNKFKEFLEYNKKNPLKTTS